jgi:ATP-dependent Clp protease protease subunit
MRTVVEERNKSLVVMDVFSKLIQKRIIFIDSVIDDSLANEVIAQILYLDSIDQSLITIYINSPGGSVHCGLAIYDVLKVIKSPIKTVNVGIAASMAAVLMLAGKERVGLKHSRIMLHQPSGGASGSYTEMAITVKEVEKLQQELYQIVEEITSITKAEQKFLFDTWYTAKEALNVNILTKIL